MRLHFSILFLVRSVLGVFINAFCLTTISAQQLDISYLENQYKSASTSENVNALSKAYQKRGEWFSTLPQFDKDSAMFYFNKSIRLLEENQPTNFKNLAEVYSKIIVFKYHSHYYVGGDSMVKKALGYYEKIPEPKNSNLLFYTILYHQSMIYIEFGEFKLAQDIFVKASNLVVNETNPEIQAQIYLDRALYYMRFAFKREIKLSVENAEKSFKIYEALGSPEKYKALLMVNYAKQIALPLPKNKDSVDFYFNQVAEILPHITDIDSYLRYYNYVGYHYVDINQTAKAKSIMFEGLKFLDHYKLANINTRESLNMNLGLLAEKEGDKLSAFNYHIKSGEVALAINTRASKLDYYAELSTAYEIKGDFAEALKFHKLYLEDEVKLIEEQNGKSLKETELQLNVAQQEKELSQKNAQQSLLLAATVIALLLVGAFAFIFYKERKTKTKLEAKNKIIEQQAEVLKQLDAAKTRFFANVSHELRTPLTLMLAPLGTMLKSKTLDNRNFTLATLARQHSQQLLSLVNEILDLTKLESGKMVAHVEPTEIYEFTRRLVATFESYAEQRGIKLVFNFDKKVPRALMLDKPKFEKIFNNLLSNALKFTPNGGSITVRVTDTASDWQLAVIDTGRGIHPDDLPHVFNRFYQTNQTDAPIEGGTGIGLALSNELAQVMGGIVKVESRLGEGATFILELPKQEVLGGINGELNDELSAVNGDNDSYELLGMRDENNHKLSSNNSQLPTVLVVEDNPSLREYLKLILSDKYNVVTAENGEEALEQLRITNSELQNGNELQPQLDVIRISKFAIDLVISDIMMPVMDGFQLLEKLKADDKLRSIPVVMLTARAEIQDKLKALTIGVDDYLIKPFEEDELFARIKNLLRNAAARRDAIYSASDDINEDAIYLQDEVHSQNAISRVSTENNIWLNELKKMVHKHISDLNLSVDILGELMYMSRAQFYRRVQMITGLTPLQYIQEIRFNHARSLLEQRKMSSVKAVASAIGIQKPQYFSEQFKERFGKLPSEYLV